MCTDPVWKICLEDSLKHPSKFPVDRNRCKQQLLVYGSRLGLPCKKYVFTFSRGLLDSFPYQSCICYLNYLLSKSKATLPCANIHVMVLQTVFLFLPFCCNLEYKKLRLRYWFECILVCSWSFFKCFRNFCAFCRYIFCYLN